MGKICLPCNMTPEESAEYLSKFTGLCSGREVEYVSELFEQYLFYETWGTKDMRDCICTHCGCGEYGGHFQLYREEDPAFFKHSHGDSIECPQCGEPVTLVSVGRMRSFKTLDQTIRVTFCRVAPDGALLLTSGWATKTYSFDDFRPDPIFNEKVRTCLLPGKRMQWTKKQDWDGWRYRNSGWEENPAVKEPFAPFMYTSDGSYYLIGPEYINDSALRYCQLGEWYHEETHVDLDDQRDLVRYVIQYLSAYTEYPVIEMAVKLNMTDAVTELVREGKKNSKLLNWRASTIAEFLKLSKKDSKLFLQHGGDLEELAAYRAAQKNGEVNGMADFVRLAEAVGSIGDLPLLVQCASTAGCSPDQAVHYMAKFFSSGRIGYGLRIWRDYLDMAQTLEYDLSRRDVTMPKLLMQRHDDAAATIKIKHEEKAQASYKVRYSNLKKLYEFELDGMCIVVPESAQDIINEGKVLHHCVGGYAARHVSGKVDILFLRRTRKPNTPFVTIEMIPRKSVSDPATLVQIHGYENERYSLGHYGPEEKYGWFVDAWIDWLRHGSKRNNVGKPVLPAKKEKTA